MPYARNADLPDPVRQSLPEAAQTVWRRAFGEAVGDGQDEGAAAAIAWAAVKNGWHKKGDEWVSKESQEHEDQAGKTVTLRGEEIFSVGTFNGDRYTERDLDQMVDAFQALKGRLDPPVKLGHNDRQPDTKGFEREDGKPALGWVDNLRRAGKKLVADFVQVPQKVAGLIKQGAYRKKSSEIYWNFQDGGKVYPRALKAVALLGADIPANRDIASLSALYDERGNEYREYMVDEEAEPIASLDGLPVTVKAQLDDGARRVWLEAYNALCQAGVMNRWQAEDAAWGAVKKAGYGPKMDRWVKYREGGEALGAEEPKGQGEAERSQVVNLEEVEAELEEFGSKLAEVTKGRVGAPAIRQFLSEIKGKVRTLVGRKDHQEEGMDIHPYEDDRSTLDALAEYLAVLQGLTDDDLGGLPAEALDALLEAVDVFLADEGEYTDTHGYQGHGGAHGGHGGSHGGGGMGPIGKGAARKRVLGALGGRRGELLADLRNMRSMKLTSKGAEGLRREMIKGAQGELAAVRKKMVAARAKYGPALKRQSEWYPWSGYAEWSQAQVNDLPDAAFAAILPGGTKDDSGKTEPRSLRLLPHHGAGVEDPMDHDSVDMPHLRNAMARVSQADMPMPMMRRAMQHLQAHARGRGMGDEEMAQMEKQEKEVQKRMSELEELTRRYSDLEAQVKTFAEKVEAVEKDRKDAEDAKAKAEVEAKGYAERLTSAEKALAEERKARRLSELRALAAGFPFIPGTEAEKADKLYRLEQADAKLYDERVAEWAALNTQMAGSGLLDQRAYGRPDSEGLGAMARMDKMIGEVIGTGRAKDRAEATRLVAGENPRLYSEAQREHERRAARGGE